MGKFYYEFCILKYVLQSYANLKCFGKNFLCYVPCLASHLSIFLIPMKKIYIEMLSWFCCLVFDSCDLVSILFTDVKRGRSWKAIKTRRISSSYLCFQSQVLLESWELIPMTGGLRGRGRANKGVSGLSWKHREKREKDFPRQGQIMHIETSEWWVSFCQAAPEKLQNQSKIGLRQTKEFKRKWEL